MSIQTADSVNDLLNGGGGPPSFKFDKIGDTAKGVITDLNTSQVRDFTSNELKVYDDGNPIMQIVITIRQDDDEEARIFVKPSAKVAIREAVQKAGAKGLEKGGRIAVKYSDDEAPEKRGLNPKKLFTAQYEAPTKSISEKDLL